ncbi:Muniscin C-terminal mu homology domain-containing protein [Scheffersomyces xylosifermentans]|uniref:Muniscin C-terminal mu homology domain-containing protein n=1 Tax=Scheffersomyces xylosifermentans TaxID=1304137 RepID=UPI00315C77CF
MAEDSAEQFNYPTTILTSKTPEQAALILPNGLNTAYKLIDTDLVRWFKEYRDTVSAYNNGLKTLLKEGSAFFTESNNNGEFANFPRHWNCLLASLQIEQAANQVLISRLDSEIIRPLKDVVEKDVRLSELLVNSSELSEISAGLGHGKSNAEMQWNYKAPQIFQTFEDFKKFETQFLFDIVLNYFQTHNAKLTKGLTNNENSTNYLLKNYKLDNEMKFHLEWLVNNKFVPEKGGFVNQQQQQQEKQINKQNRRLSNLPAYKNHQAEDRNKPSKLKSRVGSIFGRRNKKSKAKNGLNNEAIPETASLQSTPSNVFHTRTSSIISRANSFRRQPTDTSNHGPLPATPTTAHSGTFPSQGQAQQPIEEQPTPQKQLSQPPPIVDSPNVVKYGDSESSSDEEGPEEPGSGRRLSMLQRHDLAPEPEPVQQQSQPFHETRPVEKTALPTLAPPATSQAPLSVPRSRQSSAGKYSFEAGDDQQPISATPRSSVQNVFEPDSAPHSEPSEPIASKDTYPLPPPQPAAPHRERSEVNSQMFHNLPLARESLIQPMTTGGSIPALIPQDTGMSISKTDYFRHFDSSHGLDTKGLNASIADVINANFRDGKLVKSQIIGEIAFTYRPKENEKSLPVEPILVKIPNSYEKLILNNSFVDKLSEDTFKISPALVTSKTLGGLKYVIRLTEAQVPLIVQQVWKYEAHQASLVIKLRLNPSIRTQVTFENLVVSVALKNTVVASSASSKPQGAFNKEKSRITWRYNHPLVLGGDIVEEKLIARFMTNGKGQEDDSGVQLKFLIHDHPIKFTTIYDYNDDNKEIPSVRNVTSGSYNGHA